MWLRLCLFLLAFVPMALPMQAGWFDTMTSYFRKPAPALPPKIKVLVVHDEAGVVLEVKGKYKIYDPHTGEHLSTRFIGKRKFIQAVRDGLKWGEEFPTIYQLLIMPDESSTTTIVDGVEYRGPIYVYDIGGTISIVNEIGIEDFLASTLPSRYDDPIPEETLAAVAIAARTAAYYRAENPKSQYWSVDGRQAGYQGYVANPSNAVNRAIQSTRNMVMSTASPNEDKIRPFLAVWKQDERSGSGPDVVSKISVAEAAQIAQQGGHAAQILAKAFPGAKIELVNNASDTTQN